MATPLDSSEVRKDMKYNELSHSKKLISYPCLGFWSDICGFGSLLEKNHWNLSELNFNGVMSLQRNFYDVIGSTKLADIYPYPYDCTLILNDGIAKTVNMTNLHPAYSFGFIIYIRDLLISHYNFWRIAKNYNVSVRSVLSAGEFIPYACNNKNGDTILQYNPNNISEYGKQILKTTYVYNPTEFQMNTAFAKAYTIESLGKRAGINPDYFYIESSTVELINSIPKIDFVINSNVLTISFDTIPRMELQISNTLSLHIKGLDVIVYEISSFHILKELDGNDVIIKFGVLE